MGFFGKIVGKAVNDAIYKASDGKKMVSTDYSKAAINIIKRKIENITFGVSIISTIIFLIFYGFMIYSKNDSIVNIVIYSVLTLLLIVSTILDIIIFRVSRKEMNFIERKTFSLYKKVKRDSLLIFRLVIKVFSIGYAIFIIAKYGQTTGRIITVVMSIVALAIQLIIHFIACFVTDCINYMVIGITTDVDNSGILFLVDKNKQEKKMSNEFLRTKSDKKILEDLEKQKEKDNHIQKDDDEIKIKYGKYQLECKNRALLLSNDTKKLLEALTAAQDKYSQTHESNNTPKEVLDVIKLVEAVYNKSYSCDEDSYINAIAFIVYYNNLYDASMNFYESNEYYIVDKILLDIKCLKDFESKK